MNRLARSLLLALIIPSLASGAEESFFHEQVVPILQRRCVGCHSDSESKGEFSVESRSGAFENDFIIPGDAANSRFIEVIVPVDGKAEMPKGKDPITPKEVAVLTKWVADGAEWPSGVSVEEAKVADFDWWSLKPLTRPDVPKAGDAKEWPIRTPIDAFVIAKLKEKRLTPSPIADRRTLVRRLYFDLIGLPPTPSQVKSFVNDTDPNAYERLVDQLLKSKHYGERWARHWLDVVHYADTHGYDKDKLRPNAWPYRDYVIRSLNEDKPYARFVEEQIAGDVLWPYTEDGITATGFIAAGPWDFIGHAEVPESKIDGRIARHLDRDDMVSSTMNTFTSTTVQCARCHNHKFDPITQEHYYSLQTIFAALDRADRSYDDDPEVGKERERLTGRERELVSQKSKLDARVKELGGKGLSDLEQEIRELKKQLADQDRKPEFGYHSELSDDVNAEKWVQIDLGEETPIEQIKLYGAHDDFGGIGAGFGFPLRFRIEASNDDEFSELVTTLVDRTSKDFPNPGVKPRSFPVTKVKARYVRFTATKLFDRKGKYIFALGEMEVLSSGKNVASNKSVSSKDSIEAPVRWQRKNLVDGYGYGRERNRGIKEGLAAKEKERDELVKRHVPSAVRAELENVTQQLANTKESLATLPTGKKVYAGTIHHGSGSFKGTGAVGGKPRTINVLHRGDILQPRQLASPGRFPISNEDDWRFQIAEDQDEGARRVELTKWVTAKDNPLTWRSIVNRVWQYHFGRGIVDTPNDFGRMGATPTHPELLDWLAVEFRDGGQSLKELHKLIVTSSVYRQASANQPENAAVDSGNQFLWRMGRRRLTAEEIRDAVLSVAGKLNKRMGGPGVQLFELERAEHSPHYEYHKHDPDDPASHRRSVYRFIVRSQPDPFMTTLDCADSSQSVPTRIETVTPLQALSLMNNKFMLAMSKRFAESVAVKSESVDDQVLAAFEVALGRQPSKLEHNELTRYADEHGLANTCRLLFNLNEFVFVD